MEPVTYTLTPEGASPEEYAASVREFTARAVSHGNDLLLPVIREYQAYLREYRLEEVRDSEEYLLELLSFGLLWNSYGGYALAIRRAPFITLARMAEWRKHHQRWKPAIDIARGILVTLFLLPRRGETHPRTFPTFRSVDRLCLWLEATGEFKEQAIRFIRWRAYWETMPPEQRTAMGSAILAFTEWFARESLGALGKYTVNVEPFLKGAPSRYRWREDRIQCTRSRAEYHLNMVGAEIMNRAFRKDFLHTEARSVLVPGCMRGRPDGVCEAKRVPEGLQCSGCLPECRVNQLREMGKRHDFDVTIIPHASDLSLWSPRPGRPRRGVVASACVTTLVEGGWELKRYDVPAQCVLLNYAGCNKHWRKDGVETFFNMRELKRILDGNQREKVQAEET